MLALPRFFVNSQNHEFFPHFLYILLFFSGDYGFELIFNGFFSMISVLEIAVGKLCG